MSHDESVRQRVTFVLALRVWPTVLGLSFLAYAALRPQPGFLGGITPRHPIISPTVFAVAGLLQLLSAQWPTEFRRPAVAAALLATIGRCMALLVYGVPDLAWQHSVAGSTIWASAAVAVLVIYRLTIELVAIGTPPRGDGGLPTTV